MDLDFDKSNEEDNSLDQERRSVEIDKFISNNLPVLLASFGLLMFLVSCLLLQFIPTSAP